MKNIITKESVRHLNENDPIILIENFLFNEHELARNLAAMFIGIEINQDYKMYSEVLLSSMNNEIHFDNVRLGNKSAWTIAIVLAENLKEEDYTKLKSEFDKWDSDERNGLLNWLKDYPEHIQILSSGKIE